MKILSPLQRQLLRLGACRAAVKWVGKRSLTRAWDECPNTGWKLWLCLEMRGVPGWPSCKQVLEAEAQALGQAEAQALGQAWEGRYNAAHTLRRLLRIPKRLIIPKQRTYAKR